MREVAQGAGIAFVVKVAGAAAMFCFSIVVARNLGARGAGVFFLCLTIVNVTSTLGRLGVDNALLRYVASHAVEHEWQTVRAAYRNGFVFVLTASGTLALALYFFAPWVGGVLFNKPDIIAPLRGISVAVVPMALFWVHGEALKGLNRILASQIVQGLVLPVVAISIFLAASYPRTTNTAIIAYLTGSAAALLLAIFAWFHFLEPPTSAPATFSRRKFLSTCMPLVGVAAASMTINWAPFVTLGIWGTQADLGVFGAASRMSVLISFVLIAVNSVAAPKFAALYHRGDRTTLQATASHATLLLMALSTPAIALFLFYPQGPLSLFGPEFTRGSSILRILALGQLVNVSTGSVAYLLIMSGRERLLRNNTCGCAVLSIFISSILVPPFGILGAALATTIALASSNIISAYLVWTRLRISTLPFHTIRRHQQ